MSFLFSLGCLVPKKLNKIYQKENETLFRSLISILAQIDLLGLRAPTTVALTHCEALTDTG